VELYLLLAEYAGLHLTAGMVAACLYLLLPTRVRSKVFLSLSLIGFMGSVILLNPRAFGGVHLFVIFWASLFFIALEYYWTSKKAHPNSRSSTA
jgi:hypothetical protein